MKTLTDRVFLRAKEMLKDPKIYAEYQKQDSEEDAKKWILDQSLITLMYSPSKRKKMIEKKQKKNNLIDLKYDT